MLRIFQTGDNHIGLKYANHEKADVLKSVRIDAFDNMVDAANREECDLFVITGDLFENTNGVSMKDIKALLDKLSCFHGVVVVLPGNHDYYDADVKVWQDFKKAIADMDNIMLLTEYKPYSINAGDEEVVLYPAHCTTRRSKSGKNNLDWIKAEKIISDNTYRIGIAHGAVQGKTIDKEGQYFLMTHEELENIPVDVWLIGHTHVPFPCDLTENYAECGKIFNAGTHVQTDVSCNTEGVCFIIEIDDNKKVRAKKLCSGSIRFYRKNIRLSAGEMESIINRELADIADNSVVDLILDGAVTADEYNDRSAVIEKILSRFTEGTYNDSSLSKLISKELVDAEFAETSFSGKLLTALLDEPKEAQLVYDMLKSLKEGK